MGSQSHRPTPPPLISFRRHLFSPLFDEGGCGGVAAALVVLVLAPSPPASAAAAAPSRSPSPEEEDDASPGPDASAPSPSRSTLARAAGGRRRTRRWTTANPSPRGGTAEIRTDAEQPPPADALLGSGRSSDREGDATGSDAAARVSAAAEAEAMSADACPPGTLIPRSRKNRRALAAPRRARVEEGGIGGEGSG
ncbi:Os02g0649750 [Oryza sativa Japonica Group]|uniref:Os02g0649750 protein n=1 Tax=Oryza sativa subsp. japonica TaxID=39947 RepID=A0A0P0VMQ1_ORYSJ|nr:hypothetical protein EE612_012709 [Oryza sativa]BAS80043.1 Os02g0649750 [Oryza sativa Japonica Group]